MQDADYAVYHGRRQAEAGAAASSIIVALLLVYPIKWSIEALTSPNQQVRAEARRKIWKLYVGAVLVLFSIVLLGLSKMNESAYYTLFSIAMLATHALFLIPPALTNAERAPQRGRWVWRAAAAGIGAAFLFGLGIAGAAIDQSTTPHVLVMTAAAGIAFALRGWRFQLPAQSAAQSGPQG